MFLSVKVGRLKKINNGKTLQSLKLHNIFEKQRKPGSDSLVETRFRGFSGYLSKFRECSESHVRMSESAYGSIRGPSETPISSPSIFW